VTSPDLAARRSVADRLEALVGALDDSWRAALAIDADFLAAYIDLAEVPVRQGRLTAVERALISLGVTAAVTTLDHAGMRTALVQAKAAGATRDQALEAVHLVSVLGVHTLVTGYPEIARVAEQHGQRLVPESVLSAEQERIKQAFSAQRGYWSPLNEMLVRVDPAMFEAYTAFSSQPWVHGSLSPKLRELIYVAIDLSPAHLFTAGVGPHIENALRYGATLGELVETLEVTALCGIASVRAAAPLILELFGDGAD